MGVNLRGAEKALHTPGVGEAKGTNHKLLSNNKSVQQTTGAKGKALHKHDEGKARKTKNY